MLSTATIGVMQIHYQVRVKTAFFLFLGPGMVEAWRVNEII